MPFRSGPIGYSRFRVVGEAPSFPDEALLARLGQHVLERRRDDDAPSREVASGFCSGRHVFDTSFRYEDCAFGSSLLAAMRIDTAKVPGEIRHAYRVMAEDARRPESEPQSGISRGARRDAREEADERCRKDLAEGRYRSIKLVPFLWDLPTATLLAPVTGDAQFKELKSLFDAALGLRLERRSAASLAGDLLGARGLSAALEDALPDALTARPADLVARDDVGEAPASRAAGRPEVPWAHAAGEPNDFLGDLFLVWLWWRCARDEGIVETGDGGPTVALTIERTLDMDCVWGITGSQALRADAPTRLEEALTGLRSGKWPRKLGLILEAHGQEFRCSLQGDRFSVAGLAIPEPDEARSLMPRQLLEERVDRVLTFDRMLVALYTAFLRERFGSAWPTRTEQLRAWIASGRKRPAPRRDATETGAGERNGVAHASTPDDEAHAALSPA